ncbi:MAG TPA: apolipoprotein N-acyltransferase [Verrucomicrobiae bacterium]|nr:apolipoprotein N-acyltransferase [Verrucomicrobiae bacterium]
MAPVRYALAAFAGLVLASAFPNIGIAGAGWIAPGLLAATALGTRGRRSFGLGYVAGMAHYLASLYWLLCIPVQGYPILGWIALSAFLSLFPATWTWLICRWSPPAGSPASSGGIRLPAGLILLAKATWNHRTRWALGAAALWVAIEMVIARIFGGFPWNLLGASQYELLPLIQISAITGVYGVSFLMVWGSMALLCALSMIVKDPRARSPGVREMALPALGVSIAMAFGFAHLRNPAVPERTLRVTLIQPSIPQTMIWNRDDDMERFTALLKLTEQSLTNDAALVIWPEAAIPKLLRYEKEIFDPLSALAQEHRIWMIVGADDAEPSRKAPGRAEYYNSSFLLNPNGRLADRYRKRSLVIFGEYIPLEQWMPFLKNFTPVTSSFTPGDEAVPFRMAIQPRGLDADTNDVSLVKTSVLICFEDNFPHLVRTYVDADTDFLVNITNNGWFGESAAQWQHAANAIFRAIENGIPLIRCSNNGLTCWVDRHGRLREIFRDAQETIYGEGFLTIEVPLLNEGQTSGDTFYRRNGDWFGWGCVVASVGGILAASLKRKRF